MACGSDAGPTSSQKNAESVSMDSEMGDVRILYVLFTKQSDFDAKALLEKHGKGELKILDAPEDGRTKSGVLLRVQSVADRPLPQAQALPYFSRGFSDKAAQQLYECKTAVTLIGLGPFDPKHRLLKQQTVAVYEIAKEIEAFIFDEADSLTFTQEAFYDIRVSEIERGELTANQFGVRAYREGEGLRSVSMGLEKFGQKNFCVPAFAEHHMGVMDSMMSLMMQSLIEANRVIKPGEFEVDATSLKTKSEKQKFSQILASDGGTGKMNVELVSIEPVSGDPQELLGIKFESNAGPDLWQEHDQFLTTLFGKSREVSSGVDMGSLDEAIEKARTAAAKILADTNKWTTPGRRLKCAVRHPEIQEVIWVEVKSWKDNQGAGILLSSPYGTSEYKSGDTMSFAVDNIVDYQLSDSEGTIEKGGVDEMVRQMQGR